MYFLCLYCFHNGIRTYAQLLTLEGEFLCIECHKRSYIHIGVSARMN